MVSTIPPGFCQCGCGNLAPISKRSYFAKGYVKGLSRRFILGHHRRLSPVEYIIDPSNNCWVWQRAKNPLGYGRMRVNGCLRSSHIVFYEREFGPVPDGLELDHLCRNPACVNPNHLEAVTHWENIRRGNGRLNGAKFQWAKTHCPQGHEYNVKNTYISKLKKRHCRECNRIREANKRKKEV